MRLQKANLKAFLKPMFPKPAFRKLRPTPPEKRNGGAAIPEAEFRIYTPILCEEANTWKVLWYIYICVCVYVFPFFWPVETLEPENTFGVYFRPSEEWRRGDLIRLEGWQFPSQNGNSFWGHLGSIFWQSVAFNGEVPSRPECAKRLLLVSSIAVEDAVENRGLYRVFVSRLFERALDTVAPQSRS